VQWQRRIDAGRVIFITVMVALAACLGRATAYAMHTGPVKGYRRFAHHFLDSAFWTAYREFQQSAKG